jgi:transcriptional regulator with XRE-family HTH domain
MEAKPGTKSGGAGGGVKTDLGVQVGKVAREAREKLGLTQADVAERVGLAAEVYGRVERGAMLPSTPMLVKICLTLGISADLLVGLAVKDHESEATQARPAPKEELSPEIRRLLRTVRTMDSEQLSIFKGVAAGLLKLNRRRRQRRKRDEAQGVAT